MFDLPCRLAYLTESRSVILLTCKAFRVLAKPAVYDLIIDFSPRRGDRMPAKDFGNILGKRLSTRVSSIAHGSSTIGASAIISPPQQGAGGHVRVGDDSLAIQLRHGDLRRRIVEFAAAFPNMQELHIFTSLHPRHLSDLAVRPRGGYTKLEPTVLEVVLQCARKHGLKAVMFTTRIDGSREGVVLDVKAGRATKMRNEVGMETVRLEKRD